MRIPCIDTDYVMRALRDDGVILTGHFVLAGGEHSEGYVEKTRMLLSSEKTQLYCRDIACHWANENIEAVVGPATAGIKLSTVVALELYQLTGRDVISLYTEKDNNGNQILKRGKEDIRKKRTLVVEDIGTTGGSVAATIGQCLMANADVVGCHILVDRSNGRITAETLGVNKYLCTVKVDIENYLESKCPLCEHKVPINIDFGHGGEYLKGCPEKKNW